MIAYDKRTTIAIHEKMPISKKKNELVNNQGRGQTFCPAGAKVQSETCGKFRTLQTRKVNFQTDQNFKSWR